MIYSTPWGSNASDVKTHREIKALNEKIDKLLLAQQHQVHFISDDEHPPIQAAEAQHQEDMCYVQNQGGNNKGYFNYSNNPGLSYRSNNVANPQGHVYPAPPQKDIRPFLDYAYKRGFFATTPPRDRYPFPPPPRASTHIEALLEQLLHGHETSMLETSNKFGELHTQLDSSFNDIYAKLDTLTSRISSLEHKTASISASSSDTLHYASTSQPHVVGHVKAITLRSGKTLPPQQPTLLTEDSGVQVGGGGIVFERNVFERK